MDMIDRLISREGGAKVVNIAGDPGGLTKFGISKRAYPQLDIANLTYQEARDLYNNDYLVKTHIIQLPIRIREMVFDFAVHSGPQTAIRALQRLLGQQQDGILGPKTLAAAHSFPAEAIVHDLSRERITFLVKQVEDNPNKLKFLRGWVSRVFNVLTACLFD